MAGRRDGVRSVVVFFLILLASTPEFNRTCTSAGVAQGEPWFYLRLELAVTRIGLTLLRVLRKGLWLDEDLSGSALGERPR